MPMLFSPTIGSAIFAKNWYLHGRCPAYRTTSSVDLRRFDWRRNAEVTALISMLSCRACRPNRPFANLGKFSQSSVADELEVSRNRTAIGE